MLSWGWSAEEVRRGSPLTGLSGSLTPLELHYGPGQWVSVFWLPAQHSTTNLKKNNETKHHLTLNNMADCKGAETKNGGTPEQRNTGILKSIANRGERL